MIKSGSFIFSSFIAAFKVALSNPSSPILSTYRPNFHISTKSVLAVTTLERKKKNLWTPSTSLILHSIIMIMYQSVQSKVFWFYVLCDKIYHIFRLGCISSMFELGGGKWRTGGCIYLHEMELSYT